MARFTDKTFVVTGGSSGIGKATALRLAEEGGRVIITGTTQAKLDAVANGSTIIGLQNDAGVSADAEALAAAVTEHFGRLDAVFFNAGYVVMTGHHEATAEQFDQQYAVNVRGPILQAKWLSPIMKDGGNMLFNTSEGKDLGMEGMVLYGSTKGALRSVVRVLCKELAPRNIRVNAVSPGPIQTDFLGRAGVPAEHANAMMEGVRSMVPLQRIGTSEELAAVAVFLMSEEASYVTGAELSVDGGFNQV